MSVLTGGIFSRPRGQMGGVVFGAARTRAGKLVTSRLKVIPSNPNTAAQQTQRTKFAQCQDIVRRLGASVYQGVWNRSVGQLPGFQSMQSIFMNQMDSSFDLTLVNDINLGTLEPLLDVEVTVDSESQITFSWNDAVSGNGTIADKVYVLCIAQEKTAREEALNVVVGGPVARSVEALVFNELTGTTNYQFYLYVEGAGTAEGLTSIASHYTGTTTA